MKNLERNKHVRICNPNRLEQKRLELEIMTEMRRPLEDMSLGDHKDLPEFTRIPNLKLSGEAFANTLMVYEFLHNFGETLGFGKDIFL